MKTIKKRIRDVKSTKVNTYILQKKKYLKVKYRKFYFNYTYTIKIHNNDFYFK